MTLLDRLEPALRSAWLPLALLLIALSTVFIFGGDRDSFYRGVDHNWISSEHLEVAVNLSPEHGFQRFRYQLINEDGDVRYRPYNRFPIGGYLSMKLATLPVSGTPTARLYAARILMLLFFVAAAVLAYLSLCRLASNRWIALTTTLLAFASYYLLYYNDMTANEGMIDLFGVMLAFHGMVIFVQEGRFRQLLIKACIALLLGWHVLALLLPFVIIGLASDILRARSAADASLPPTVLHRGMRAASTLIRSRYLMLGIVALGVSLSISTFNFTMEYVALDGETPLTELPSFQSMLERTPVNLSGYANRFWRPFLEEQFQSILRMFIPYSLIARVGILESTALLREFRSEIVVPVAYPPFAGVAAWLSGSPGVVLGIVLSATCLIGSAFVRPRILFATLASFGFVWALPMHNTTAEHDFEAIYYIGLPLVFFTIVLLLARRLRGRDGVIAIAAVVAAALFAVSSFEMSRVAYSSDADRTAKAVEHDLLTIRELTEDERGVVLGLGAIYRLAFFGGGNIMHYYLNVNPMSGGYPAPTGPKFVVMRQRIDTDALITPQNQYLFLYDAQGLTADLIASYRAAHPSVVSAEPLAREDFDVYMDDSTLYYVKEPCQRGDTRGILSLHVFPEDIDDLPYYRREHGFDNLDFLFIERGVMFDGKCMASADLPQYDIAGFRTGSHAPDGRKWTVAHVIQGPKLVSAYQSIVSGEPAARSGFDLYIDEGKLYYVKEPCGSEDVQDGFFLHIIPADIDDLPYHRRAHGFDNLDFGFDVRGIVFDGKCAAAVPLPQYGIAQITTGQYDAAGRIWTADIDLEANE